MREGKTGGAYEFRSDLRQKSSGNTVDVRGPGLSQFF